MDPNDPSEAILDVRHYGSSFCCTGRGTAAVDATTALACFSDDFSSIDGDWVSVDGDWSWSGGTVDNNVGNQREGNILYRDADYSDGYLEASVSVSRNQAGLLFRITDMPSAANYFNNAGQMYYCGIMKKWVRCGRMNNAWYELFVYSTAIAHGQFYDLGINMEGSDFTVFLDGAEIGSFSDSSYRSGGIGFRTWQGHGTYDAISFKAPGCAGFPTSTRTGDDDDSDDNSLAVILGVVAAVVIVVGIVVFAIMKRRKSAKSPPEPAPAHPVHEPPPTPLAPIKAEALEMMTETAEVTEEAPNLPPGHLTGAEAAALMAEGEPPPQQSAGWGRRFASWRAVEEPSPPPEEEFEPEC